MLWLQWWRPTLEVVDVVVAVGVGGNCIAWLSCCVAIRGMQKWHFRREGVAKMKNSSAAKGQTHKKCERHPGQNRIFYILNTSRARSLFHACNQNGKCVWPSNHCAAHTHTHTAFGQAQTIWLHTHSVSRSDMSRWVASDFAAHVNKFKHFRCTCVAFRVPWVISLHTRSVW